MVQILLRQGSFCFFEDLKKDLYWNETNTPALTNTTYCKGKGKTVEKLYFLTRRLLNHGGRDGCFQKDKIKEQDSGQSGLLEMFLTMK